MKLATPGRNQNMSSQPPVGLNVDFSYTVPPERTVPRLLPESKEFKVMPEVLATGYMVGLFEWACILAVNPYLDWPREQTVGIDVRLSHLAPTPPGLTIRITGRLTEVKGRRLVFSLSGRDGLDLISEGIHVRQVIEVEKFNRKVREKAAQWSEPIPRLTDSN